VSLGQIDIMISGSPAGASEMPLSSRLFANHKKGLNFACKQRYSVANNADLRKDQGLVMAKISEPIMREYLKRSISSINRNKLNGMLAEIDFRDYLSAIGWAENVSVGGWIARSVGSQNFAKSTVVLFPQTILPDVEYPAELPTKEPSIGLHTICATFHQIGVRAFFCSPTIPSENDAEGIRWMIRELGIPRDSAYVNLEVCGHEFTKRDRKYKHLRYESEVSGIPSIAIPDEFSKENLRVAFSNTHMAEISDVDGILWGEKFTYPLEIKEKTPGNDSRLGDFFGIDVGPFVKLAYYASQKGNMNSLFVVKEIDDINTRNLVSWWFITYEQLAKFASWTQRPGGQNMQGGGSSTVLIPKSEFTELTAQSMASL